LLSFARPTKLFTANESLIVKRVAILEDAPFREILSTIISALQKVMPAELDAADDMTDSSVA